MGPHVVRFKAAIEQVRGAVEEERAERDHNARMPEWGPDSRTYAHISGVISGLQWALDILESEYGAACAEQGAADAAKA